MTGRALAFALLALLPAAPARLALAEGHGPAAPPPVAPVVAPSAAAAAKGGDAQKRFGTDAAIAREAAARAAEQDIPYSLTARALLDELRQTRAGQARAGAEREALAAERARLDRTAAEIAQARAALRDETARLETLVGHGATCAAAAPTVPPEVLAKTLKVMKPEQAAGVIAKLDRPLAVELLRHMKPAEAGPVLDRMSTERAAELIRSMAANQPGATR
ncbi:magnesium transporter MgtE N-terminal domain-containing protein [Anaeromyxobacter paludicola]|uniref:Magnesium transporter MgtE intracellular domain-containing protein n=1 Tax=Anaeromyxobacter paludicola TaxID=2918171 RepID=A0ABM7X831_9BACT|nr:hypothetical protein [Anaeromyxobacter paludicola]BDG07972.1 hypothetical protein AMPC_10850 [Anaeromyxobacter paludicola]